MKKTIYALVDPRTGRVRYVGETGSPASRYKNHLYHGHSAPIKKWVGELRRAGLKPQMWQTMCPTEGEAWWALRPDLNRNPPDDVIRQPRNWTKSYCPTCGHAKIVSTGIPAWGPLTKDETKPFLAYQLFPRPPRSAKEAP